MTARLLVPLALVVASLPAIAWAGGDHHVFPERNDDRASRAATWAPAAGWQVSTPEVPHGGGTRVAALASVTGAAPVTLEARGVDDDGSGRCTGKAGPWHALTQTFARDEVRVATVDLERHYACAQLRLRGDDDARVADLQWELVTPRYPNAGAVARALAAQPAPVRQVGPELQQIGVISREEWGALPTGCTQPEDDWYRMAIHHTAGPQTAGGTVQGRLQATQAYAMDSGTWCDIPYQMLVGYDGSLWEGRGLELFSGATGGGNNDGNLAVCFIGCYHEPQADCVGGVGHGVTDEMMARGQLLVQTLVRLHDIPTSSDDIRGHRDWPGNSTACPGSLLHPRLQELRDDLAWFSAVEVGRSWDGDIVEVELGQSVELWVELENTGGLPWTPGATFMAPTPRDQPSAVGDVAWPSPVRAATVTAEIAPGDVGRFTFTVAPASTTPVEQTFGLVHEGVTWFADHPWGGGPGDDALTITVVGIAVSHDDTGGDEGSSGGGTTAAGEGTTTSGEGTTTEATAGETTAGGGAADDSADGCACATGRAGTPWLGALVLGWGVRRRRRANPRGSRSRRHAG
jgi:MYXO-CTERM domain-containing protein